MPRSTSHTRLIILCFAGLTLTPMLSYSQSFYALRRDRNFLVSFGSGTANYYGEMVNPGEFGTLKPNVAAGAEMYVTNRISVRSELTWFQLSGNDARANDDRVERNLSFRSNCIELDALGAINLTPMGLRFYQRSTLNFHAFAGVGALYHNPKAELNGKWIPLQPLRTENVKYSRLQVVIPFGMGARIKLNPFFNLLVEAGYRYTFTDYLDDASKSRYVEASLLKSDLARTMSDRREGENKPSKPSVVGRRGNPDRNDGYFITNVTLQYYLPVLVFGDAYRKLYSVRKKSYYRKPRGR